ncbi:Hsp70-like protein [Globisporangium polare]
MVDGDKRHNGADAATVAVRRPQTAYSQIRHFLGVTPDHQSSPLKNVARGTVSLEHNSKKLFHAGVLVATRAQSSTGTLSASQIPKLAITWEKVSFNVRIKNLATKKLEEKKVLPGV